MIQSKSTADIVASVRKVTGPGNIALHEPMLSKTEFAASVEQHGMTGYSAIDELSEKLAKITGSEQVLLTSSGTAALHLALMTVGVQPFQEVLVPTLTFVGTANAIAHCGAIPNFVDVRTYDLGVNPYKLTRYLGRICEKRDGGTFNRQSGRRIACLITVDLLGIPCDMMAIREACGRWGIPVIEDAAQALGSIYRGKSCGANGYIGVMSFNNNKIVTTNGGGAMFTDDPFLQAKAWSLATTARVKHPWRMDHSEVAWNYRMGNINAALGLTQIDHLEMFVDWKRRLYEAYVEQFGETSEIVPVADGSRTNRWLNVLILPPLDHRRDEILQALYADGISARTLFTPIHDLPMYKHSPRDNLEEAQMIWRRIICLPSSPYLGKRFL